MTRCAARSCVVHGSRSVGASGPSSFMRSHKLSRSMASKERAVSPCVMARTGEGWTLCVTLPRSMSPATRLRRRGGRDVSGLARGVGLDQFGITDELAEDGLALVHHDELAVLERDEVLAVPRRGLPEVLEA